MVVTIADSGIGMLPEKLASIRKQLENDTEPPARHIGLFNTHRRLRLIFGDDYSITVRSKFGWGTAITMHLPIH